MLGVFHGEVVFSWGRPLFRPRDGFAPTQIGSRDGGGVRHDLFGRSVGHDLATFQSSPGTEVAEPIGLAEGVFIVFNHQEGVSKVAEFSQGLQQSVVVALMEANGRFVENVHDAGQATTDLRGQANALTFSTRKGVGFSVQRQIIKTDAVKKPKTAFNFLDDFRADEHASFIKRFEKVLKGCRRPFTVRVPSTNKSKRIVDRTLTHFRETNTPHRDITGCIVQFLTVATRTIEVGHGGNQSVSCSL